MPQIDKVVFFPQVFGLFLILIFCFYLFFQNHGINLASIFKIRGWFLHTLKSVNNKEINFHLYILVKYINLKKWFLEIKNINLINN